MKDLNAGRDNTTRENAKHSDKNRRNSKLCKGVATNVKDRNMECKGTKYSNMQSEKLEYEAWRYKA